MRSFFKSFFGFSWAMTLFGLKGAGDVLRPGDGEGEEGAGSHLDEVTRAARDELGPGLRDVFEAGDELQRDVVDRVFDVFSGSADRPARGTLDPAVMVVLGEELAAGMGHFGLESTTQVWSFGTQLAQALGTGHNQPLIQPPGLGDVLGMAGQKPIVPDILQSTVLEELPAEPAFDNVSVPGFRLADAIGLRPTAPLVDRDSAKQTLANLILGLPGMPHGDGPGPTQVEYARARNPTLALVVLGFREAAEAATAGDPAALPGAAGFRSDYGRLLRGLGGGATVVAATIPDPLDTAYFSNLETAAKILKTLPSFLESHYGLTSGDVITLPGLFEIGYQMMNREVGALAARPAISGSDAAALSSGVDALNQAIRAAARQRGAHVWDLHALFRRLAREGAAVAGRSLNADYLGGLFLLNGLYPGPTGHALIARDLVQWINETFGTSFAEPSVEAVAAQDPNTECRLAPGPPATDEFLAPRSPQELPPLPPLDPPPRETPIQTTYPNLMPSKAGCVPLVGVPAGGLSDPGYHDPGHPPLELPLELPAGLEQTLDLNPAGSYFGDALRAVDCPNDKSLFPPEFKIPPFGLCGNVFFGGPVLTSSPLHGKVHVKFSPPDGDNVSRFEIRHPGGLTGEDADLQAPKMFRMRSQFTLIQDIPELVSSGKLHLDTGRVTDLHYNLRNINTALLTLFGVNPHLPPVGLLFPGSPNGGSTWAQFEQRADGRLDLTLAAHMFLPLGLEWGGEPVRFALPFGTPDLRTASFVARGTSLHPRIHITTKSEVVEPGPEKAPEIPLNTVQEFTAFTRNTNFGDEFGLNSPDLGEGGATGRSHLLGRVRVQIGPRCGTSAPVLFQVLPPGGLLNDTPLPPPFLPPGISRGMSGFNAIMRFPKQTYPQAGLASADDPFNLAVGNVDLRTGRIVDQLLFRSYVIQQLFAALVQVEPCTPSDSFNYQGLAAFERGAGGQIVLRFNGTVYLPYPTGFKFPSPSPDGRPPFVMSADSRLDPFRRIRAMSRPDKAAGVMSGQGENVESSTNQRFSYRFSIPRDPAEGAASFEYTNHEQGGTFTLSSLSWLDCMHSLGSDESQPPDTVTFSGFGSWSLDPSSALHQVSVQISTAPQAPYVGIQVDGGVTSNVDTKPPEIEDTYA